MKSKEFKLHMKNLGLSFPKCIEWSKDLIVLYKYKPFGVGKDYPYIPIFKKPVELSVLEDKITYRVVAKYPMIMVSASGIVRYTDTAKLIKQHPTPVYKRLAIMVNNVKVSISGHRLVALAWIPNDDYVTKNVVDHRDGKKINNVVSNLRWVSNATNVASASNRTDRRWWVKKIGSDIIHKFSSLTKVGEFFRRNKASYSATRAPFKVVVSTGTYIVEDVLNFTGWSLEQEDSKPIKIAKLRLLNLKTNKEIVFKAVKEVMNFLNVSKATVRYRFDYRKGVPIKGYNVAINDEPYPAIQERPIQRGVILEKDGEVKEFESLRKAAEFLNIDRKTLVKNSERNGYTITIKQ